MTTANEMMDRIITGMAATRASCGMAKGTVS